MRFSQLARQPANCARVVQRIGALAVETPKRAFAPCRQEAEQGQESHTARAGRSSSLPHASIFALTPGTVNSKTEHGAVHNVHGTERDQPARPSFVECN